MICFFIYNKNTSLHYSIYELLFIQKQIADVAKLVDALGLGPNGATHESSSLSVRTHDRDSSQLYTQLYFFKSRANTDCLVWLFSFTSNGNWDINFYKNRGSFWV